MKKLEEILKKNQGSGGESGGAHMGELVSQIDVLLMKKKLLEEQLKEAKNQITTFQKEIVVLTCELQKEMEVNIFLFQNLSEGLQK